MISWDDDALKEAADTALDWDEGAAIYNARTGQRRSADKVRDTAALRGYRLAWTHPGPDSPLSGRQAAILEYAIRSILQRGWIPTAGEIGAHLGCGTSTVLADYVRMSALGYAAIRPHGVRMYAPTRRPDGRPFTFPRSGRLLGATP